MSFLFPLAAVLGLLAVPVIALYLLKTRQRQKPVSTLLFWKTLKPKIENSPLWRKLRRWLSLALQLLILALLVAAIARPAFDWERDDPQRTVLVLDPSASMLANQPPPSRWDIAVRQAEVAIERLRIGDEIAILSAENPPRLLSGWTTSRRDLREALQSAHPLDVGTDPVAAMRLARELAVLRGEARIEFLSDAVWPVGAAEAMQLDERVTVSGPGDVSASNAGISHFAVRRSPVAPGDWQLDAEIVSNVPFDGIVEIFRNGEPMDRASIEAGPDAAWQKSWRGTGNGGAEFRAVITPAAGDQLVTDDTAVCTLDPLRPLRVVWCGAVGGLLDPYLEAALDSIPLVEWTRSDVVPATVPDGTDLMVITGDAAPEAHPGCPVLLVDPKRSGWWGERGRAADDAPITDLQAQSKLLRHASLGATSVRASANWVPPPGAEVFASSFDTPVIFGDWDRSVGMRRESSGEGSEVGVGEDGRRDASAPSGTSDSRWLVFGFDAAQSNLPLRTAFPILLANVLQSVREEEDRTYGTYRSYGAAALPGVVESKLEPFAAATKNSDGGAGAGIPSLPGWWWVLLVGLVALLAEAFLYHRRITD